MHGIRASSNVMAEVVALFPQFRHTEDVDCDAHCASRCVAMEKNKKMPMQPGWVSDYRSTTRVTRNALNSPNAFVARSQVCKSTDCTQRNREA